MNLLSSLFFQVFFPIFLTLFSAVIFFIQEKNPTWAIVSGFVAWCSIGLALTITCYNYVFYETETYGTLWPSNDPLQNSKCFRDNMVKTDALAVDLGTNVSWSTQFPFTILQCKGRDLLWVDKISGRLAIFAKIYSTDGKIVAEIKNNRFYINPNNYFRRVRPDKHTLIVYDQSGQEVLNIRFKSPSVFKVTGIFNFPGVNPIIVTDKSIKTINSVFSGNCVGQCKVAFAFN